VLGRTDNGETSSDGTGRIAEIVGGKGTISCGSPLLEVMLDHNAKRLPFSSTAALSFMEKDSDPETHFIPIAFRWHWAITYFLPKL